MESVDALYDFGSRIFRMGYAFHILLSSFCFELRNISDYFDDFWFEFYIKIFDGQRCILYYIMKKKSLEKLGIADFQLLYRNICKLDRMITVWQTFESFVRSFFMELDSYFKSFFES